MKYLIFDFDGVLGDTFAHRQRIVGELENMTPEQVQEEADRYFTNSDHTRKHVFSEEEFEEMRRWNISFGTKMSQSEFVLFEGFIEELKRISNAKFAVVSSGSSLYIKPKLEKSGLKFDPILDFQDHHSKEHKVEQICAQWGVGLKDIYFITDTVSDYNELKDLIDPNKIYACAWGYQGYDKLAAAMDKDHILKDFADIHKIFEKVIQ